MAAKRDMERCRVCGCTEEAACPGGCGWAEPGLCTSCVPASGSGTPAAAATTDTAPKRDQLDIGEELRRVGELLQELVDRYHLMDPRWRPRTRPDVEALVTTARRDITTLIAEVQLAWSIVEQLAVMQAQARAQQAKARPRPLIATPHEYALELAERRGG